MRPARGWLGAGCAILLLAALGPAPARPEALPTPTAPRQRASFDVLQLESPLPARTFFAESQFTMGSTHEEMLSAHNECILEVLGHTCNAKHFQNEGPVRSVTLGSYQLDRYEVTVADYERCVRTRRCTPVPFYKGAQRFRSPRLPVVLVSWEDARDYCSFVGGRLPTEAEWERAARGIAGRRYPWGNAYNPRVANHGRLAHNPTDDEDGFSELAPVGSYPAGATPDLVFDLAGNVEEWTLDRYREQYDPNDVQNPRGAPSTSGEAARSVRGGSYTSPRVSLRSAARRFALPAERHAGRGFRCAYPRRD